MTDSPRRRASKAKRLLETLCGVRLAAIRQGSNGRLIVVTAPLIVNAKLYSQQAYEAAYARAKAIARGRPFWVRLERGYEGGLHIHLVIAHEAVHSLPDGVNVRPVWNLKRLAWYLSKPIDGKAARSKHRRTVSSTDKLAASEEYLDARSQCLAEGRQHLPPSSGVGNMPRIVKMIALVLPALLFECLLASLKAEAGRLARWKAAIDTRRARRPFAPKASPRPFMAPF